MIMSRLIDPVGDALEFTLLGFDKVVSVDLLRGLAPLLSGILEVANGLFLLGIHTDDGILMTFKQAFDAANVAKLLVSLGNLSAFHTFAICFKAVVALFQ
jgi:hypothetical protein